MNKIFLIGRICNNLELRTTKTNKQVCEFNLAVNRDKEHTDFITCVVWEKQAENLVQYQQKGNLISVFGELRTDTYNKEDGTKGYKTYVFVNQIEYLSSKAIQESTQETTQTKVEDNDPFAEFGEQVDIDNFLD